MKAAVIATAHYNVAKSGHPPYLLCFIFWYSNILMAKYLNIIGIAFQRLESKHLSVLHQLYSFDKIYKILKDSVFLEYQCKQWI